MTDVKDVSVKIQSAKDRGATVAYLCNRNTQFAALSIDGILDHIDALTAALSEATP
jgi:hypothetical protein